MAAPFINFALIGGLVMILAVTGLVDSKSLRIRKLVKRQTNPSIQCFGFSMNVQDASDCSAYFACSNNVITRMTCPTGQVFSPAAQSCGNYPTPAGCTPSWGATGAAAGLPSGTYQCPKPDGRFQDSADCSMFYECIQNSAQRQGCPAGQLFNPKTQLCSTSYEPQGCHMSSMSVTVPPTPPPSTGLYHCPISEGTFHDTTDCSKYYVCFHWEGTMASCPASQLFDPTTNICSSTASPVGCHLNVEGSTQFRCPQSNGNFQDASDCSRYWRCVNSLASNMPCAANQLFDTQTAQCSSTRTFVSGCTMPLGSSSPTTVTSGNFVCPSSSGEFGYSEDCSQFWRCDGFVPSLRSCPGTLLFNPERGYCDWPSSLGTNPTQCRLVALSAVAPATVESVSCSTSLQASHIAHPRICNAFYICGDGKVHTPCVFCADGTYFDQGTGQCIPERAVNMTTVCPGKVMVTQDLKTKVQAGGC